MGTSSITVVWSRDQPKTAVDAHPTQDQSVGAREVHLPLSLYIHLFIYIYIFYIVLLISTVWFMSFYSYFVRVLLVEFYVRQHTKKKQIKINPQKQQQQKKTITNTLMKVIVCKCV